MTIYYSGKQVTAILDTVDGEPQNAAQVILDLLTVFDNMNNDKDFIPNNRVYVVSRCGSGALSIQFGVETDE